MGEAKRRAVALILAVTVMVGSITYMTKSWGVETTQEPVITEFQVSVKVGGIRTIYVVPEKINNKRVSERGLIYGLEGFVDENNMDINHQDKYIRAYAATSKGLISSEGGKEKYVMTMDYGAETIKAFTAEYIVRPYAKLSDGSYCYGNIARYRTYDVASKLYDESSMRNQSEHDYLYNTILNIVDNEYPLVTYSPKPENKTIENGDLMKIAFAIVSSAENSSLNFKEQYSYIENIGDGRGYTGGIIGFTSGTGDMLEVVEQYIAMKPSNNPLSPYLAALRAVNGTDSEAGLGRNFVRAWENAAKDQEMIDAQNKIVREWYLHPAVADAQTDGLSILGQFIYYDAMVMHGPGNDSESFGGIRKAALRKASPPAKGGDEATYLKAFIEARKKIMLMEEAHEDLSRLNAQLKFINEGNFAMNLPLSWTMYGDSFTLTQTILDRI